MSLKTKALTEKLSRVARSEPVTIARQTAVKDALSLMRKRRAPCLLVCDGRKLVGIFTERDYLMRVAGHARGMEPVGHFMTTKPLCADFEDTIGEAVEVMESQGLRQLPIVGSAGEVVSAVAAELVVQYLAENFPAAAINRPPEPHASAEEPDGA